MLMWCWQSSAAQQSNIGPVPAVFCLETLLDPSIHSFQKVRSATFCIHKLRSFCLLSFQKAETEKQVTEICKTCTKFFDMLKTRAVSLFFWQTMRYRIAQSSDKLNYTYKFVWIMPSTTNQSPILKVLYINTLAKCALSLFHENILLIHPQNFIAMAHEWSCVCHGTGSKLWFHRGQWSFYVR